MELSINQLMFDKAEEIVDKFQVAARVFDKAVEITV